MVAPDRAAFEQLGYGIVDHLLSSSEVKALAAHLDGIACNASTGRHGGAGGAMAMRPLLLHASSAATVPARRRVIHLEYAAGGLPGGLAWR